MRTRVLLAVLVLLLAGAFPASADLRLEFQNGFVTVDAKNVTARQILAEWARLGGTKVVNGERVPGGPVTLQLVNVPERQALEVILRTASGYMAAPRLASLAPGTSTFDRILVLPTSSAPPPSATRPMPPAAFPGRTMPGVYGQPMPRSGMVPAPGQEAEIAPIDADELAEEEEPADGEERQEAIAPAPVNPVVTPGMPQPLVTPPTSQGGPAVFPPPYVVQGGVPWNPVGGVPGNMPPDYPGAPLYPAIPPGQSTPPASPGPAPGTASTPGVIVQPAQPPQQPPEPEP